MDYSYVHYVPTVVEISEQMVGIRFCVHCVLTAEVDLICAGNQNFSNDPKGNDRTPASTNIRYCTTYYTYVCTVPMYIPYVRGVGFLKVIRLHCIICMQSLHFAFKFSSTRSTLFIAVVRSPVFAKCNGQLHGLQSTSLIEDCVKSSPE